jgi:hypothetical protein
MNEAASLDAVVGQCGQFLAVMPSSIVISGEAHTEVSASERSG